jgi:hypothetical protein
MTRSAVLERMRGAQERTQTLLTKRNLYYAGVAVLVVVNLYLLTQMVFAWNAARTQNAEAIDRQTVAMKTAEIAKKPLEGLDDKLTAATVDANKFYDKRLPYADSEVAAELGALAKKQGVKLTRAQYAYTPVMEGREGALTELRVDASLNGDYRPLVLFMNSLERDKTFFVINAVSLTGQQGGMVGLRLRLTTYLRPPTEKEASTNGAPSSVDSAAAEKEAAR